MKKLTRNFPKTRARRLRKNLAIRNLVAETNLDISKLIQPLFVSDSIKDTEEIISMPGQYRFSKEMLKFEIEQLLKLGLSTVALFPHLQKVKKNNEGSEAINPDNFLCNVIKDVKIEFPELVVIADIALDPYTSSGHDGILKGGYIDNDLTLDALSEMSINLADVGTDILAPSDMMDGRIGVIRDRLEEKEYKDVILISYAVKYASNYYGPFRDAVGSTNDNGISKDSYQMDYRNIKEAHKEVQLDIEEGADIVMVKPALSNLDIINSISKSYDVPVFSYQVSGEYSMLKYGIDKKLFDSNVIPETLMSIFRAGSNSILTYFAKLMAENK
ncbi:porphobilinogen synthase [SAR86 cluster bacterium]|jgi:porphobilinogen synthase|nr:porphobilinogen synthase [SAR86 cluster bacterium]